MGLWRKIQRTLGAGGRRRDVPSDVYIVSFPKCGRTWLTLLIGRAIQQHFGLHRADPLALRKLGDLRAGIPRIAPTHDDSAQWKAPEELSTDKERYRGKKVIFLVRDPRDVIVSNYFQKTKRVKVSRSFLLFRKPRRERRVPFHGDIAEFLHTPLGNIDSLLRFYQIWAERRNVPDDFLLVRYEDLHADTGKELRHVLDLVGLAAIPDSVVAEAVQYASFDNMRRMEKSSTFKDGKLRPADQGDAESFKTRKGKVRGYVDYLTPEQIEYLNQKMRETLSDYYGYEPNMSSGGGAGAKASG